MVMSTGQVTAREWAPGGARRGVRPTSRGACSGEPYCRICALFGHLMGTGGYLGRVGFGDGLPADKRAAMDAIRVIDAPMAYQPRKQAGRRIYGPPKGDPPRPVSYVVVDDVLDLELKHPSAAGAGERSRARRSRCCAE